MGMHLEFGLYLFTDVGQFTSLSIFGLLEKIFDFLMVLFK
jgi:hypothetical protein